MDGDKAIGEVYTNLKYAPYVEFGTGPKDKLAILVSLRGQRNLQV